MSTTHSDLVRLYVSGRLDGEAREAFETALFEDESLLAEVEAERALRNGFSGIPRNNLVGPRRRETFSLREWLPVAASFMIGVGGASAWWMTRTGQTPIQSNVQVLRLEGLRGRENGKRTFDVPADAGAVLIQVTLAAQHSASFRVSVHQLGGKSDFVAKDVRPDDEGVLNLIVPAERLPPGAYTARIAPVLAPADGPETQFEFRIRSP